MAISLDDMSSNTSFTTNVKGKVTFLPEPEPAARDLLIISCDDHVVEPPDTFIKRMPAKFADRAPRIIETDAGEEMWQVEGALLPNVGFNAVIGRPVDEYSFDPTRFDQMRRGTWDPKARIHDMNLNGIYSSLNFPSFLPGFAGQRLYKITNDPELAVAMTRAWNDWMIDEWCATAPDRFIASQLPIWSDPEVAAEEVRRNALRGFKAISFSEGPHMLGFPSLHTGHWDPIMRACEETGTVVCLHVGSSGTSPATAPDAPNDAVGALFFAYAMFAAVDWLFSKIPVRFPDLRICMSEGGIGWVAGLIDRLDHMRQYNSMYGTWNDVELSPSEVFRRNFWFCAIEDPSSFMQYEVIGENNIMVESDYPHSDSTWPKTQSMLQSHLAGLPKDVVEKITWGNAASLFNIDVPEKVQRDHKRVLMPTSALPTADPTQDAAYRAAGWWGAETLHSVVRRYAVQQPAATAFVDEHGDRMSWRRYDDLADEIAAALLATGLERGERVVVFLPDTPVVHAAFVGAERAGLVVMGVGHRAGEAELDYLLRKSQARGIITPQRHREELSSDLVARMQASHPTLQHHIIIDGPSNGTAISVNGEPAPNLAAFDRAALSARTEARHIGASELFLLNSTSGTTGLPKCVMQSQNRWFYFHQKAAEFGALRATDVFMSVVPAPFGFGLWTSHFTPTILGAPCVITERFSADTMIELIERERVTVLCCVSTQFIMMLNSPVLDKHDVSSLRVMFTGGEAIPYGRALEFEQRTGGQVLNFYGSNETGILSGTRVSDDNQHRLTSGGRVLPDMDVRLYTEAGVRIDGDRGRGVPACKGPALSLGYYDDAEANATLYIDGGWMLMGDVVEIDTDGWLTVVGRTSDFIIRGGKNISAPAVEDEVATHPAVSMVAVVAAPDPVFGERVAAYVELHPGHTLTLEDLKAHLSARGVSREWYPEYLHVTDQLPRASGAKVAKGELRKDAAIRFG